MKVQTLKVLNMLRQGPITQFDARHAEVLCLTKRISDLRDMGYDIDCEMITDPSHHNGKTRFGRWTLISEKYGMEFS